MNRTRVAALLRELADELEGDAATPAAPPEPALPPKPKKKSAPRLRLLPEIEVDEVARAKARRMLRRAGVVAS